MPWIGKKTEESAEGSLTLPLPPEPNKRKLDASKCIICHCSRGSEPLRTAKDSSAEKLITSAKQRRDEVPCGLGDDACGGNVLWHSPCYASYRSAENIRYVVNSLESSRSIRDANIESDDQQDNESGRLSRSVGEVLDWTKCLFCKNRTYKKSKELINVCTFEASNSTRKAAEAKGDESMLHILRAESI